MLTTSELETAIATAKAAGLWGGTNGISVYIDDSSEVYHVRDSIWQKAHGGCLCIGCLEKRVARKLKPKDFPREHPYNYASIPGTARLLKRRKVRA